MLIEATAMKLRQNLGEMINQVQYRNASIEITKSSKPVAALISIELFDKIKLMNKEFQALTSKIQSSFKNENSKEIDGLIKQAVIASRAKNKEIKVKKRNLK